MSAIPSDPFADTDDVTVEGPAGQLAHRSAVEHLERLAPKLWAVGDKAWCVVGNGLSNQSFVEGPEGLIAFDSGESIEEMTEALALVRTATSPPIAAVVYTHFHYVGGTTAALAEADDADSVPVIGHAGIVENLARQAGEVNPKSRRGLIHQFGIRLPEDGPDGLLHAGLGLAFRHGRHAPFTNGFVPPTVTLDEPTRMTIAGLDAHLIPAPSDADDSIHVWLPELGVAVNNICWPTLFNVFAIRGEEYRDPRVLLRGLDGLRSLGADHLLATHGPPISGAQAVDDALRDSRDAVQFLWDQTVRGMNKGWSADEIATRVRLPARFDRSYVTQRFYGAVEHHVRQIHNGLVGWFDEDVANLFRLAPADRAARLVDGFGGTEVVRGRIDDGLADPCSGDDLRWALELSSWLVPDPTTGELQDRIRQAAILRRIARRTTAANIRNWCLTRALELDGSIDLRGLRDHRLGQREAATLGTKAFAVLRVMLDPEASADADLHVAAVVDGERVGLHVRGGVAVPTDGDGADVTVTLDGDDAAAWWSTAEPTLADLVSLGRAEVAGDAEALGRFATWFDHPAL